jgi:hypothetical protein
MPDLHLTENELIAIMDEELERFKVHYDDIPKEGHSSQYIEDDGRQLRYFEFEDTQTSQTYSFSYVWYPDWGFELYNILGQHNGIVFVKESVLNLLNEPVVAAPPPPVLTPEQLADKELWARYQAIEGEVTPMDRTKKVPKAVIADIIQFLKQREFNLYQLRANIIPVCIEYKIDHKSFWEFIQIKRGVWKKRK